MTDKRQKLQIVRSGGFFGKGDVWTFIALVVLVALLTAAAFLFRGGQGGTARVTVDGAVVKELDLSKNERYVLQTEDGYNVIVVANGSVWVEDADCADHTCMRYGKAKRAGETIICLPHGVKIVVVGGKTGGSDV